MTAGLLLLNVVLAAAAWAGLIDWVLLVLLYAVIFLPIIALALAVVQFGQMLGQSRTPCFGWVAFVSAEAAIAASALVGLGFAYGILLHL